MTDMKKGRILIVDDEPEVLNPLNEFLIKSGYKVSAYTSAKEALEALKAHEFDLFLTDLIMPEMTGIELLKSAFEIDPLLVGIVITGKGTVETAVEVMKTGAFDYIMKPLEWKILIQIISRALEVRFLRVKEKRYRSIVEGQVELICRFLPDGTVTYVNESICRYFGKKHEELIGHSFMPFIPVEDHEFVKKQIYSLNKDNSVITIEHRVIAPNGEIRWQRWTNHALFDEHNRIIEYQAVGHDITDRKKAEESLKLSEEKYRLLIENANEIIVVAQDNMLKFVNPKTIKIMGFSEQELMSRPFIDFIHPDDKEMVLNNHLKRLKGEKISEVYPFRVIDKNGHTKWLEISAVLITWEGRPATLNFLSDITVRKLAEEKLKNSYKQLRSLSIRLSEVEEAEKQALASELHDQIGQNLTVLGINLNIIKSLLGNKENAEILSRIDDSLALLNQTNEQMRDIMSNLRPSLIDDYGLLAGLRWYGEQFSKRTGIRVEVTGEEFDQRLPKNIETLLFRIAQESLTNIAKHSRADRVTIKLQGTDGMEQLIIADNGVGFDLNAVRQSKEPKWGIITMKERVQAIGGNFQIKTKQGDGTTLIVEIKK